MPRKPAAAEPECLVCVLVDNDEEEAAEVRFARAIAHGDLVLGKGHGLATCARHDRILRGELRDLRRELRALERDTEDED